MLNTKVNFELNILDSVHYQSIENNWFLNKKGSLIREKNKIKIGEENLAFKGYYFLLSLHLSSKNMPNYFV